MRRALGIVLGLILAAVCLWLFFRGVDAAALWRRVSGANPLLLAVLVASSIAHMALRAQRWRTLLGPAGRDIAFKELFAAVSIGYMALVLPLRISEVLRPTVLSRRVGTPFGTTLASVAAERFALDLPMLVVFLGLFLVLPTSFTGLLTGVDTAHLQSMRFFGAAILVVSVVGLAVAISLARRRESLSAGLERFALRRGPGVGARAAAGVKSLLPGLGAFASASSLARLGVETALIWVAIAIGIHCGVAACGVDLAPGATLAIIPITALGIAVPTPGGAGTYHLAMKVSLVNLFGAAEDAAVGAALVAHALPLLAVIPMGGWFALRGGLSRTVPSAGPAAETAR